MLTKFKTNILYKVLGMLFIVAIIILVFPNWVRVEIKFADAYTPEVGFYNMDSFGNMESQGMMEYYHDVYKFTKLNLEQAFRENGSQYRFAFYLDSNLAPLQEGTQINISNIKISIGHWEIHTYNSQNMLIKNFTAGDLAIDADDEYIHMTVTGNQPYFQLSAVKRTIFPGLIKYILAYGMISLLILSFLILKGSAIRNRLAVLLNWRKSKYIYKSGGGYRGYALCW